MALGKAGILVRAALKRQFPERSEEEREQLLARIEQDRRMPGRGDLVSWSGGVLRRFRATVPLAEALVIHGLDPVTVKDVVGTHTAALDVCVAWLCEEGWHVEEI
jgi:hypothetical protein